MERSRFSPALSAVRPVRSCCLTFHKVSAQQGSTRWQGPLVRNRAVFRQRYTQPQNIPSIEQQGSTRGQGRLVMDSAIFLSERQKIAPCSNIGTRGYPAVFGSITRTSFCFLFLPCAEVLRCTRTPTAGKEHAFARFRTTACRLRNDRTLSASGRFSTWDSPPSIALNLYSKGAAPREGLLLFSGSGYSIAVRLLFVNDLINKN